MGGDIVFETFNDGNELMSHDNRMLILYSLMGNNTADSLLELEESTFR